MTQAESVHSTPPINTSASDDDVHTPESLQGALYRRTDLSPEDFFQALGRIRREARDEIERLIEWLDATIDCDEDQASDDVPCDGDTDAEPSLGSFDRMSDQIKAWQSRGWGDVDVELDQCDKEPSLGFREVLYASDFNQTKGHGSTDDREGDGCADHREGDELQHGGDEHDGAEPDEPEPSLGSTEILNQERWAQGKPCGYIDAELGIAASRPQNRTRVETSPESLKQIRPCLPWDRRAEFERDLAPRRSNVGPIIASWRAE